MSFTHNKNPNPLLNVLFNCISARSAPQILSMKGECTFLLLRFLIIDLCNSYANSLLEIFSISNTIIRSFLIKKNFFIEALKQDLFDINHILGF